MKYDVFLSYAHEDSVAAQWLVSTMKAEGLSVFWDRHIAVGQQWSDVLQTTLLEARAVVVIWSAASVKSTWVKAEATEAMTLKKLVPVRVDGVAIPMPFGQVQTADVSPGRALHEQGVSIAASIAALTNRNADAAEAWSPAPASASASRIVDWRHAFLSMEGRLGRRDYWICYLALVPISALAILLVEALVGASAKDATFDVKQKALVFAYFITLYPRIAILIKRLHDFGWSGWWTLPIALIGLLQSAAAPLLESNDASERHFAWLCAVVVWSMVIFVGARAGTPGANRYGPQHGR